MTLKLTSTAFAQHESIPQKYTGDGPDLSPPLQWTDPAKSANSFALIMEDPNAPRKAWTHWVLFNLPGDVRELPEGISGGALPQGAVEGKNDFGKLGYGGPAPPPGMPHRYHFKLYALDRALDLPAGASKDDLRSAMKDHVLVGAELAGKYSR